MTADLPADRPPVLADGPIVTVRLLQLPVPILAAAQQHSDELMREFTLITERLAEEPDPSHPTRPIPTRLIEIMAAFDRSYGPFTGEPEARLAAAMRDGESVIEELVYEVPASAAEAAAQLGALLDEADNYCRTGKHLLTLATPAELVLFRRWFLDEFQVQVAGAAPTPWPDYAAAHGNG